jgi:hypothetical protein
VGGFKVGLGFPQGFLMVCFRSILGFIYGWLSVGLGLFRLGLGNFKGWFSSNLGFCQVFF